MPVEYLDIYTMTRDLNDAKTNTIPL